MNKILGVTLFLTIAGVSVAQQHRNHGSKTLPVLVQILRLSGDQYSGFRESCLLVFADGHYHREVRQQETQDDNRPTGNWNKVKTFEGEMTSSDLHNLNDLIQSSDFRAMSGTIGNPDWRRRVAFGLSTVIPHDIVNILAASVSHAKGSQVFEVFLPTAHLEPSLKSFVKWVDAWDRQKLAPTQDAEANDCAMSPGVGAAHPWAPQTSFAKLISQAAPDSSSKDAKSMSEGTVRIRAIINVDGSVAPVSVIHGINPAIDREAMDTVKKWRFQPAQLVGLPVAMRMDLEVNFHAR